MAFLTSRTIATGITLNDLFHIVKPYDTSQNPSGSSYKSSVEQLFDSLSGYRLTANTMNILSTPNIDTNLNTEILTRDSSTGDVKIKQTPGPLVYGLFSQTSSSIPVVNTITETTIINGGVGTLSVPANGFQVGDSFHAILSGILSANNNNTIRIRIKSGVVILGDSGLITLPSITSKFFDINLSFTIRTIGVAGVASIVSSGQFTYSKDAGNAFEGGDFLSINNTTFDTTVGNTLDITVEWGTASLGNSISTEIFVLNKIF
jgi:hypothetical protein